MAKQVQCPIKNSKARTNPQTDVGEGTQLIRKVPPTPPSPDGHRAFSMLEAYLDESGIHDGAHACVIAGYWGGEKQWRNFERAWKRIIEDADTPGLIEFHASKFWASTHDGKRKGVYTHWSNSKADIFLGNLLDCIGSHKVYPYGYLRSKSPRGRPSIRLSARS